MNYEAAEWEIVNRLQAWFSDHALASTFEAVLLPDNTAEAEALNRSFNKPRVLVEFKGIQPDPPKGLPVIAQDESVQFRFTFEVRRLRGPQGLWRLLAEVKKALIGYKLTGATNKLEMARFAFDSVAENTLVYYLEMECKAINQQAFPEPGETPINHPDHPLVIDLIS